jgi:large subunit ribosomal protein L21
MTYAIFRAGGQQFRAEKGLRLEIPLMADAEPGSKLTFDEVLLTGTGDAIVAGTPLVKGARVAAKVLEQVKGDKITVFKFKRRKNYRRKTGHRQKFTQIEITDVKVG